MMKKQVKYFVAMILMVTMVIVVSCDDKDDEPSPQGQKKVYTLNSVAGSGVTGTVTFTRQDDGTTQISIVLTGTAAGDMHPSHIHANSAAEGGGIVIDLTDVDGASGMSETIVDEMNDGTPITYQELINFDGYVNVHKSASELSTLVAQGDIGSNADGSADDDGGGTGY
ncbi:CHRD domain-containing protein [Echinicola sp. CAU 1574]|uniref:CHRD domain-containing protein n=1 Tax=Echinicola arenosa TaxID=2774144 RepID=A0ABR9AEX8_9BACT|nr:CHRD domain-containing protein [Echinicola arenosa]MBD8487135.1 CHRD domain-containing protein [Echinicola arenosa]